MSTNNVDFEKLKVENSAAIQIAEKFVIARFGKNSMDYLVISIDEIFKDIEALREYKYFIIDVENLEDFSIGIAFDFCEQDERQSESDFLRVLVGILPRLKTRISIPLSILDGQTLFLERTPGRLKAVVQGCKIDLDKMKKLKIGTIRTFKEINVKIHAIYFSDTPPCEYPIIETTYVDKFGQLVFKDWPDKTKSEEELTNYLNSELKRANTIISSEDGNLSKYRGWKYKKFEATGFFRVENDGNRWWMVDPDGYGFISIGLDCVNPGEYGRITGIEKLFSYLPQEQGIYKDAWIVYRGNNVEEKYVNFGIVNLIRAFGENWWINWAKITKSRLLYWGFNTIGNWTDIEFIRYAKMPYVLPLKNFPTTKKKIFRDFPDVFSEEYRQNSKVFAGQLEKFKNDRLMIGYFLTNEPHWAFINDLNIAEEMLECEEELASKEVFIDYISKKYNNDIKRFNKHWNLSLRTFDELKKPLKKASKLSQYAFQDLNEFSKIMIDMFCKVPSEETKKIDSNHLNLGMRFAWISSENLYEGSKYFDVFSINCYQINPYTDIDNISQKINRPILIGEFHFGALDRGLLATGLRGVKTQMDRGKAYRYYMESAASHKNFVGAHYFILNDQPVLGRFDGENYQIGLVDVCHKPYYEFVRYIKITNYELYEVAAGLRKRSLEHPIEIPKIAF